MAHGARLLRHVGGDSGRDRARGDQRADAPRRGVQRARRTPGSRKLLWWAMGLKLASALVRYAVAFGVYDGQADASMYHQTAAVFARQIRDGDWALDLGRRVQGTGFIQVLTSVLYTVIGPTSIGGFLVYSWFGFWGLYLFHRAFVRACPEGDHWRYALLVFLLAVVAVLAIEHRQGSLDLPGAGRRRLRRFTAADQCSRWSAADRAREPHALHGATAHRRVDLGGDVHCLPPEAASEGRVDPVPDREVRGDHPPRHRSGDRCGAARAVLRTGRVQRRGGAGHAPGSLRPDVARQDRRSPARPTPTSTPAGSRRPS